jgi:G3E family GTPase
VQTWLNDEALLHPHHHHSHDVSRHDKHIRSFALRDQRAISPQGLEMFLEMLTALYGPNLLRVKGLLKLSDEPNHPLAIHGVQHVFHPPARLASWPDGLAQTRLVFIVKDIEKVQIEKLFQALIDPFSGAMDKTLSLVR